MYDNKKTTLTPYPHSAGMSRHRHCALRISAHCFIAPFACRLAMQLWPNGNTTHDACRYTVYIAAV